MRSYIKRINKILRKQSTLRVVGELSNYDTFLDWQDREVISPLVSLGHKAVEDMLTVFKTAAYPQRTIIIRALFSMGEKFVDEKATIIAALTTLLQDADLNLDGEMKRQIRGSIKKIRQSF